MYDRASTVKLFDNFDTKSKFLWFLITRYREFHFKIHQTKLKLL